MKEGLATSMELPEEPEEWEWPWCGVSKSWCFPLRKEFATKVVTFFLLMAKYLW